MNLANNITIFRIILIPFFVEMIIKYNQLPIGEGEIYRLVATAVFLIAVLSDAVDGFVARNRKEITPLGTALDPVADKLLLLSGIILLSFGGHLARLPLWFVITVISRDVIIVLGAVMLHLFNGHLKIAPNILGKATTVAQMITVLWILLEFGNPQMVWRITGILTVISGLTYIIQGSRQYEPAAHAS